MPHTTVVWLCGSFCREPQFSLPSCDRLFEGFDRCGQSASFGFAHQQVNVFGHDDITEDKEAVLHSRLFECLLEHLCRAVFHQKRLTAVATEGDEVKGADVLISLEAPGHEWRIVFVDDERR